MPITYTNRKRVTYYLCQGRTKTGKVRYYFAREPQSVPVNKIPEGYTIRESVNGIVSLAKIQPALLLEEELRTVQAALQAHPDARHYRVDAKADQITVYEHVGPDLADLTAQFAAELGLPDTLIPTAVQRMQERESDSGQFTPIMRFILTDKEARLFKAQRMRFSGTEHWINIGYNKPLRELAAALIPTLGTDEFFELF